MTRFGYTLMTEQSGPRELVAYAEAGEQAGFDFEVISDHYFPWLDEQGHAPYAWSVLGAVSQVTDQVGLMSYVTCPTMRYHPAVVAQKAATVQILSDGRFTLGLGAGESLNEHVVGWGWPHVNVRHAMLVEAVEIIGSLFDGGLVNYDGRHFRIDSGRLWDLPADRVPVAVAVSGSRSIGAVAPLADFMVGVEPSDSLVREWDEARSSAQPRFVEDRKIGQVPICWDRDVDAAIERAHAQFRWFGAGWDVNANLPTTAAFDQATQFVRKEDLAQAIPCGPDIDAIVKAVSAYWEAGFTDVAIVQIGDERQREFLEVARTEVLPALREANGSAQG
jgi:G6PDH family F420-dependent oxidoreductase